MRQLVTALAFMVACSGAAMAAPRAQAAKPAAKSNVATHSTSGVVKSMDGGTLVVTKGGKDMMFSTNASTQKEGAIAPGAHVTVRYQNEGKSMVATAINEQPARQMASKTAPKTKK